MLVLISFTSIASVHFLAIITGVIMMIISIRSLQALNPAAWLWL